MNQTNGQNHLGLRGVEFVEFASPDPDALNRLFLEFGFSRVASNPEKKIDLYRQNHINLLLNRDPQSFASDFSKKHGPCISSMGWKMDNAQSALEKATTRGARKASGDHQRLGKDLISIYGIGDSLIYFVDNLEDGQLYQQMGFKPLERPDMREGMGLMTIDHLTNNVHKGEMDQWCQFYEGIFGFEKIRYFDIRGIKTGLTSFALRSPDGSFAIPINEGTEAKSQINEYLEEYKGPGVQHLAFSTDDICQTIRQLNQSSIETLDIDDEYYQEVFDRVPNVTEDRRELQDLQILVDGDEEGYLLQIFTRNVIGPIFIEIIQRKNHFAFGEGNFGALFRSIERDQQRRGYLT